MYILLIIFLCPIIAFAQDSTQNSPCTFRGYIKNLQTVSLFDNADYSLSSNLFHNRLSFNYDVMDDISIRADMRNRIFWGEMSKTPGFETSIHSKPGILGLSEIVFNSSGILLHSMLDRISISYKPKGWNITLGRQRINWGIHTVWNPNDIFNTYNLLDFDYEERPGCDALRIQRFGENHTIELAIKPDTNLQSSIAAFLYKTNYNGFDIQSLCGVYKKDFIFGTGWAGNIGDAGFKGEMSYFLPIQNDTHNDTLAQSSISLSLQCDQTFNENWYCSIGMLYNSTVNQSHIPFTLQTNVLSPKQLFPFETTFYLGVTKQLSPINSIGCSLVYSPTNYSLIFIPVITYNIAENIDIDCVAQSFFAQNTEKKYSNLATSINLRTRWSF